MTQNMEGKVALVTGGSSGIGRATALAFAQQGAKVVVADVDVKGGEETVRMVEEGGSQGIFVKTDVTLVGEVETLVSRAVQTYGRLDYAHNNAGIEGARAPIVDYDEKVWDRMISVNLKGVWLCMKYEIPQMLKQGKGAIVNTSSICGLIATPNVSPYIASKHGVVGLTKAIAAEYAKAGIRVNAVCPGGIDTPMMDRIKAARPSSEPEQLIQGTAGRLGTPQEIAEAVVWLCSDAASFVNGHAMLVDGGSTVSYG